MAYVVCVTGVSPLRMEANHRSEMVSQLLFGEFAVVLESGKDFTRVRTLFDNYEGWCQNIQLSEVGKKDVRLQVAGYIRSENEVAYINDMPVRLSIGTPVYKKRKLQWGKFTITYKGRKIYQPEEGLNRERIKEMAFSYINTPYLWGGKSMFGIDCSGFVQQVYKFTGIYLERDAYIQAGQGEDVGFLQEAKCGDLAFFDNEEGRIIHVGILLNEKEIIHASGCVRVDKIDSEGIINTDTGRRTHHLRLLKQFRPGIRHQEPGINEIF